MNFNSDLGPNAGLDQSKERRNHYAQVFALLATVTQRFNHVGIFRREVQWRLNSRHEFCPPARPGGVMGAPPAGRSWILSLGGPLPGSLCGVRAPPGASAIAGTVLVAVTRRARFVRSVIAP